ncbi:RloB family protein [Paenibacillus herberti]|uniref:Abortive phage infection protein n=1 Tax=Paenibacillus herberti TaxID=1619309 RepID=A0A229NUE1_9BACL|nr:RloB family protein [Paenibacillus herberti]OXM13325.1 abortive phage infection protein [Paenibacillus herberti]
MVSRKPIKKYYFTVEGETEQWYLDHIKDLINAEDSAIFKVSIERKVQKNPLKYAKSVVNTSKIHITHWFDYESSEPLHVKQFKETLDALKASSSIRGKQIKYHLGYSNLTFELWMILHKNNCGYIAHRDRYLDQINRAFSEQFTELGTYKERSNFHRVLGKISLDDVKSAITRAKLIMKSNQQNDLKLHNHSGFNFYLDNPSLTIYESVEQILKECGLL